MLILVFGNPALKVDSVALKLVPDLREKFPDIVFKEFDAVEDLEDMVSSRDRDQRSRDLEEVGENLIILDSVLGIDSPKIFKGVESFADSPTYSLHDFDLPIYIKLLKKLGKIKSATIIGVPADGKHVTGHGKLLAELVVLIREIEKREKPKEENKQG